MDVEEDAKDASSSSALDEEDVLKLEPVPLTEPLKLIDGDATPSGLYAALSDESIESDSGEEEGEEEEEESVEEEEEEVFLLPSSPPVRPRKAQRAKKKKKKKKLVTQEDAFRRHLALKEQKERNRSSWAVNWGSTLTYIVVIAAVIGTYTHITYDAFSVSPPDTFRPAYPLMVTDKPYNTTSRTVSEGELKREALGIGSKRIPMYLIFKTLRWYAEKKGFMVACAHHLQHTFDVHPQMCVLHNKAANQFYSLINPTLAGFSKEKETRVEESVACGGVKSAKARYMTVHVRYSTHPSKQTMQVEFTGQAASTLQLVMDEMQGLYSCN